jgi:hypothetical protein
MKDKSYYYHSVVKHRTSGEWIGHPEKWHETASLYAVVNRRETFAEAGGASILARLIELNLAYNELFVRLACGAEVHCAEWEKAHKVL